MHRYTGRQTDMLINRWAKATDSTRECRSTWIGLHAATDR